MAKILVTGAHGQLGNETKVLAANSSHEFVFVDVAELDITQKEQVASFMDGKGYNYLINCAAYTAVDKAESDIETATAVNANAAAILADACARNNTRLIHVSTDYVFDGKGFAPYKEDYPVAPQSVYGQTKLEGEQAISSSNAEAVIIRTSWLYSSFGNNFVKTMMRLGADRDKLTVIFDQVGTPTYARDLAVTIIAIIEQTETNSKNFQPGVYHFSNEGVASWYDFAIEIMELNGLSCAVSPIETKDYPTPAARPHYSVLNKAKIKAAYNLEIPHWKTALKACLQVLSNS